MRGLKCNEAMKNTMYGPVFEWADSILKNHDHDGRVFAESLSQHELKPVARGVFSESDANGLSRAIAI